MIDDAVRVESASDLFSVDVRDLIPELRAGHVELLLPINIPLRFIDIEYA